MNSEARFKEILSVLERDRIVYTSDLIKNLNVSEATIRRDLQHLESTGKLKRIAGGAIQVKRDNILTPDDEIYMNHRMNINWEAKKSIAKMACDEIKDGECVFLDGGSSIVPMIDLLKNRRIRIVTNNHLVLARIGENCRAEVMVIGGEFMNKYSMSTGSEAVVQANAYNYDRCFVSCTGFDIEKNMSYLAEHHTKSVKNAVLNNSKIKYLLVDHSKEGVVGFCKFVELSTFDKVFCDTLNDRENCPSNFKLL